ncbi:MAG: hypothetical protein GY786_03015 [Proteobacteria bacterium]|nr:hypothetical protein [Pseudomonadota bacterium]
MKTSIFQSKRFKWMVELLKDSLEITSKNFNLGELLLSEQYSATIKTFFEGDGPSKLLFYFQSSESVQN